jgi:hypothetical protein
MAHKGDNKIRKSTGQIIPLRTGATLSATDALVASDDAYIALMHKTSRVIEIRRSGTISMAELEAMVPSGNASVSERALGYMESKINGDQQGSYRSRLAATGAVSRAVGDNSISLFLENSEGSAQFFEENAVIRWESPTEETTYVVTVLNLMNQVLLEVETTENKVELNFDEQLRDELGYNTFIIKVVDKNNAGIASDQDGIAIKRVTDNSELAGELANLRSELAEDSPIGKLILASFYEENGLLLDALTKYEEAVEMAPDVPDFQQLYDNFLYVNGFIELDEE